MLYDEEYINGLPEPASWWRAPLVAYVVKEASKPQIQLKLYLESWYERIPDSKKSSYFSRLRSSDDKEFLAQVFEFFVADFCKSYVDVDFDPILEDGKTPELIWELQDNKCLLDVVTLFDPKEKAESNNGINDLLNYLGSVEHYYDVCVKYMDINIKGLKKSAIRKQLIRYLDSLDLDNIDPEEELIIDDFGFYGSFIPVPHSNKERRNISFSLLGPVEDIEPINAIEKRIKSKLSKYKWEGPIFVAVCRVADFGVDWNDVASVLYGPMQIYYNPETKEHFENVGKGGFIMPRGINSPNNTSLTGVLHCELVWGSELPELQVKYLINPFAKCKVELPIPTYPRFDDRKVCFEWLNIDGNELSHH